MENNKHKKGLSLKNMTRILIICTFITTIGLAISLFLVTNRYRKVREANAELLALVSAADDLEIASDYLTEQGRYYVVTKDEKYYQAYFKEVNETKRRDNSLEKIKDSIDDTVAINDLEASLNESNDLMNLEFYAFRLIIESDNLNIDDYSEVKDVALTDIDKSLSSNAMQEKAINLMFSAEYNSAKDRIEEGVNNCVAKIVELSNKDLSNLNRTLIIIMSFQHTLIVVLIAILVIDVSVVYFQLVLTLNHSV